MLNLIHDDARATDSPRHADQVRKDIGDKLDLALRDPDAENVTLTRAEAALVIGLIAGAAEALAIESSTLNDEPRIDTASKESG
ncbi:hypothetical protein [Novosphingobium sp. JCM 18896]|uniref:hypothetical protein n=1 Tax=Novosphingobium sp. JCM 18896 TaxID=2989731 RepID=UPI002222864A|nr:hypothetical protein [Novosphingobium sp. JCM 18896]MCW1432503.1 hypothetical protein [Novosphingobium sp. JCM 18896]